MPTRTWALPVMLMMSFVLLLSSCSKSPKLAAFIPSDAATVTSINLNQLLDNADAKNIDDISFVKMARQELRNENPQIASIVDDIIADPTSTGLDLREDLILAVDKESNFIALAAMHKQSKFEDFVNDIASKNGIDISIEKKSGYKQFEVTGAKVAFNGDVAMFIIANHDDAMLAHLFDLKKSESMASNKMFANHWKNRGAIAVWMGMDKIIDLAELLNGYDIMAFSGLPEDYMDAVKNCNISCNLVFDKGAFRLAFETQGIDSKWMKEYKQDFNGDLVKYMPEKCLATLAYSCKMDKVVEMLAKSDEADIDVDETIAGGKSMRQLMKAFGGSLLVDMFDIVGSGDDIVPQFALALDLVDADAIRAVLDDAGMEKEGDIYKAPDFGFGNLMVCISDKALYITNSREAASKFSSGGYSNSMKGVASKVKKGNYFYADLNLGHYPASVTSLLPGNLSSLLSQWLDYTEVQSLSDTRGEWAIYLTEKKENSLLYTLRFIDKNLMELTNLTENLGTSNDDIDDYETDDYVFEF